MTDNPQIKTEPRMVVDVMLREGMLIHVFGTHEEVVAEANKALINQRFARFTSAPASAAHCNEEFQIAIRPSAISFIGIAHPENKNALGNDLVHLLLTGDEENPEVILG